MPHQITATHGKVTAIYRIIGRDIFLKSNNTMYAQQMIAQLQQKGGKFEMGKGWIKVDIFGRNTLVKLGGSVINLEEADSSSVEDVLTSFYMNTLQAQGFECKQEQI